MDTFITESWDRYLEYFDPEKKDIYYREDYTGLYGDAENIPLCVVCREGERILLMPYLRRRTGEYYDLETPYGYGGPLSNTCDSEWIKKALNDMKTLFKSEKYLCGFVRFHPLLENAELMKSGMEVIFDRKTVVMDIYRDRDDLFKNGISAKCRNKLRRAQSEGLSFEAEDDFSSLPEFIELYEATMRRLEADDFYFFPSGYYKKFTESFKGRAFLGTVKKDGRIICASLFMYDGVYGHYHLEGSDSEIRVPGANNLLIWGAADALRKEGVRYLHLGGGYNSDEENSLFKFKSSFGSDIRDFYIGKMIFMPDEYNEICREWEKKNPEKKEIYGSRLLKYRY